MPLTYMDQDRSLNLSFLHSFTQLQSLDISLNWFDHIHGYKRLEKLRTLDLSNNDFNNSVLPFLRATKSLRILNLGTNRLEGVFPPIELADMTELRVLNLASNIVGSFSVQVLEDALHSQEMDHLSGYEFADLDSLDLVFPSSLQVLNLEGNQLSLTSEGYSKICGLTNLRELYLTKNDLTSLPYCLGNLTRLRTLDLSDNQLNENLSSFVSGLPSALEYLSLVDNNFNGSFLFNSLVNQTRLTEFILSSKVGMIQAHAESSWVSLFQLKMLTLQNFILGATIPGFLVHQNNLPKVDIC